MRPRNILASGLVILISLGACGSSGGGGDAGHSSGDEDASDSGPCCGVYECSPRVTVSQQAICQALEAAGSLALADSYGSVDGTPIDGYTFGSDSCDSLCGGPATCWLNKAFVDGFDTLNGISAPTASQPSTLPAIGLKCPGSIEIVCLELCVGEA